MRKIQLSEDQLATVVAMRESGETWLGIEKKTGIDRRVAKRGFEERNKIAALPTLTSARRDFAQQAFSKHVERLQAMADSFVSCLRPPDDPKIQASADEMLDGLLNWEGITEDAPRARAIGTPSELPRARRRRSNQRLLQALQEHTRLVAPWARISQWKSAWNNMRRLLPQFRDEVRAAIAASYKNESRPIEDITQQVLQHFWHELLGATVGKEGEPLDSDIIFGSHEIPVPTSPKEEALAAFALIVGLGSQLLIAKKIDDSIRSSKVYSDLQGECNKLVVVYSEFEDILDPMILEPTIIKTQCRLCPI